ncbi:MAG: altronate oxidoreductase [Phycisphaerae bacterium]|jgi:tagaturonate reductase|nr:MAG: altronate oxidoreductase [Phycisphaerae bacterium]
MKNLPRLNRSLLLSNAFPQDLSLPSYDVGQLPIKVLQIGEGVFLRAFVDPILHELNQSAGFNGGVVVAQPRTGGHARKLNEQDGLYTVILRGNLRGNLVHKRQIIGCIQEGLDPYSQYDRWCQLARERHLRFVFSNTTEAGIALNPQDQADARPTVSFPGKIAQFLKMRFEYFQGDPSTGLIFIPCELIEDNGATLRSLILQAAGQWNYEPECVRWIEQNCLFVNTLVDRIVTGHPGPEAESIEQSLGYHDTHLNTAEPYMAWVLEAPARVRDEIPLHSVADNVIWTDHVKPYRERKVRLLNGAHTMMTPVSLLLGIQTVRQAIEEPLIRRFVRKGLFEEIIPTIPQPKNELEQFANDVIERFSNPFIAHQLKSIALNSVSKFKARLLPVLINFIVEKGHAPDCISLAAASLIELYRTVEDVSDDPSAIEAARTGDLLAQQWPVPESVRSIIGHSIRTWLEMIDEHGIEQAVRQASS